MTDRPYRSTWLGSSVLVLLCLGLASSAFAQTPKNWKAPRTEFGQPDLQGNWNNATTTGLERPAQYGGRQAMTKEEVDKIEGAARQHVEEANKPTDPKLKVQDLPTDCGYGFTGTNCGYNNFWTDRGMTVMRVHGEPRTSIIIEPSNGRLPPLTADAQKRAAARMAARRGFGPLDGPEARPLGERCIMSFGSSAGPPMLPSMYNNTYTIVQNKDSVIVVAEMVHDARVIRLNGQHLPKSVSPWMGDTIGHWEGDTLVAETINLNPAQNFRGSDENLKVTEKFTRVSPREILYRFTMEDPTAYSQPITGEVIFNYTPDHQYEYACHEGNYALPGILAGARQEERDAATAGKAVAPRRSAEKDAEGE